jgi:hypothetical protein
LLRKWGEQFRIESFVTVKPATLAGIEKYLGSGLVPGIGRVMAERMVQHFGLATLDLIEKEPQRLQEVDGIGRVRQAAILAAWDAQREVRRVMLFLQSNGVSASHAVRIWKQYGDHAIEVVTENPYRLALDVFGIGFATADKIARNLGIANDSPRRAEAGVLHVLTGLSDEGHVFAPRPSLVQSATEMPTLASAGRRASPGHPLLRQLREEGLERGRCRLRARGEAAAQCSWPKSYVVDIVVVARSHGRAGQQPNPVHCPDIIEPCIARVMPDSRISDIGTIDEDSGLKRATADDAGLDTYRIPLLELDCACPGQFDPTSVVIFDLALPKDPQMKCGVQIVVTTAIDREQDAVGHRHWVDRRFEHLHRGIARIQHEVGRLSGGRVIYVK